MTQRWSVWSPMMMNWLTEKRCTPWLTGATTTTSVIPRSWWWISGDGPVSTPTYPSTGLQWSGSTAVAETSPRTSPGLLTHSPPVSLLSQATEEIRSELKNPQTAALWRASWLAASPPGTGTAPESPAENSSDDPAHRRRWASLPPGHLHPATCEESTEDHQRLWTLLAATIRQTVLQHQDQNQQNTRRLLLAGHQTAEPQIANYTHPPLTLDFIYTPDTLTIYFYIVYICSSSYV